MPGAGELRERVAFDVRTDADDGAGNVKGAYTEQFVRSAKITPRLGGEEVMAARLAGRQPVTITVSYDSQTKMITPAWRARDTRSGAVFQIRAIANPDQRHQFLDILAESGNAAV